MRKWQSGLVLATVIAMALAATPTVRAELATEVDMENVARNWVTESTYRLGSWADDAQPTLGEAHEIRRDGRLLGRYYDILPRGYVVVPVLKEMGPVKFYSDESNLGELQEGGLMQLIADVLADRLDLYIQVYGDLDAAQPAAGEVVFDPEQKSRWDRMAVTAKEFRVDQSLAAIEQGGPLIISSWHQRAPYNNLAPMGDGGRCVVGCTATSLSQILDYWEWPETGIGDHSYFWGGDDCNGGYVPAQTLYADFSDGYDWASIVDSCDGSVPCTGAQEAALAELCYEAGVAVEMNYSACGSGAPMNMSSLVDFFKYSSSISREYRTDHTVQSWFDIIQAEVDAGRVMWYHINSHAIVCDGWRDDGGGQLEFHMDYGWGEGSSTWYVLDNLYCPWVVGSICPYEQEDVTINIQPQYSPSVEFVGQTVTESTGDTDGLIEASESADVTVTVRNLGNTATNAAGSLSTTDPYVTVTTAATSFGAPFAWGDESSSQTPFAIEIDPSCPDPHLATLELEITADGGYVTTETFLLFIGDTPGFADDMESGEGFWRHDNVRLAYSDQWHPETYRSHSTATSWKAGGAGATNHSDESDGGLVTPPFLLPPDAVLSFWHWIQLEDDAGMTAWDGAIVMISTGDGNWTQIHPVGGYPYTIIDNDASPFAPGTPCYSGAYDWAEAVFDLSGHSGVVQIMFRFGADAAVNFEGWYVDDVLVDGTEVSCCEGRVGDANGIGGDEPTIGDVSAMIDAKFITGTCVGVVECLLECDINQSGGPIPTCDDVTIGDISTLIDYLFITGETLGLPQCLEMM